MSMRVLQFAINRVVLLLATLVPMLFSAQISSGKNIDLVTLPKRNTVQLTIYNSEDITLAKETRNVTLKKGSNKLQFSWAGTLIDPTSVHIRPLDHQDEIEVLDTVFSGQKPQHLIWNIQSEVEGEVPVEVSYFTSGLTWTMDYVAISNAEETELSFKGFVRVFNRSGEEYDNAQIRLVVGNINLVEKIANLARQSGSQPPTPEAADFGLLRNLALMKSLSSPAANAAIVENESRSEPKPIVKEGLSEYFIFAVGGEETIQNGWSKRIRAMKADSVKFDIVYRMRSFQYGDRPVRFFTWQNNKEHGLGDSPMPNGLIRVFQGNGNEGLGYLGQQSVNYVPVQADIEINLGADDLVVYQRRRDLTNRSNFTFDRFKRKVTGWDERQQWIDTVRNYRDKAIHLELRLRIGGDVEMLAKNTESFDFNTVEAVLDITARDKKEYPYLLDIHHQANAKQNRLRLKPTQ
ncbi:MAG: hypothetical protein ACI9HK_003501 [Pirellulaceae bacterium]|jgi:hypothetical protein